MITKEDIEKAELLIKKYKIDFIKQKILEIDNKIKLNSENLCNAIFKEIKDKVKETLILKDDKKILILSEWYPDNVIKIFNGIILNNLTLNPINYDQAKEQICYKLDFCFANFICNLKNLTEFLFEKEKCLEEKIFLIKTFYESEWKNKELAENFKINFEKHFKKINFFEMWKKRQDFLYAIEILNINNIQIKLDLIRMILENHFNDFDSYSKLIKDKKTNNLFLVSKALKEFFIKYSNENNNFSYILNTFITYDGFFINLDYGFNIRELYSLHFFSKEHFYDCIIMSLKLLYTVSNNANHSISQIFDVILNEFNTTSYDLILSSHIPSVCALIFGQWRELLVGFNNYEENPLRIPWDNLKNWFFRLEIFDKRKSIFDYLEKKKKIRIKQTFQKFLKNENSISLYIYKIYFESTALLINSEWIDFLLLLILCFVSNLKEKDFIFLNSYFDTSLSLNFQKYLLDHQRFYEEWEKRNSKN